jgi:hypothetical protein
MPGEGHYAIRINYEESEVLMPPSNANKMTAPKRIAVRIALATGSTFATILGAQSLAVQQQAQWAADATPTDTAQPASQPTMIPTVAAQAPTLVIQHAAPNIVILRQPGQPGTVTQQAAPAQTAPIAIVPPSPVQAAAPPPVVVQSQPQTVYVPAPSSGGGSSGGSSQPSQPRTRRSGR